MKILLVSGHTSGYNECSITGVNEGDLNIDAIAILKSLLDPYADVTVYPISNDMYLDNKNDALKVNLSDYDYVYEQHFNAFNGTTHGNMVAVHEDYEGSIELEQKIADVLGSFGFTKRKYNGIYRTSGFLNMCTCLKLGVKYCLNEMCFYDNVSDMKLYKENKGKILSGIAQAIIAEFELNADYSVETEMKVFYRVGTYWMNGKCLKQHGIFKSLDNAKIDCDRAVKENHVSYYVFNSKGTVVYSKAYITRSAIPVLKAKHVKVISKNLNVRGTPKIDKSRNILTTISYGTTMEYIETVTGKDGKKFHKVAAYVSARTDLTKLV